VEDKQKDEYREPWDVESWERPPPSNDENGRYHALKDSGARQDFGTGSVRDLGENKGAYDLLQEFGIHANAMQLERGMKKYGNRNWEKGQPVSRYIQSARRHLAYHMMGLRDEPHMAAAAWNVLCAIDTAVRCRIGLLPKELDDVVVLSDEQQKLLLDELKNR